MTPAGSFLRWYTHDLDKNRRGNRLACLSSSYGYEKRYFINTVFPRIQSRYQIEPGLELNPYPSKLIEPTVTVLISTLSRYEPM